MAVVSRDEGISQACAENDRLHHFKELPSYLVAVASEDTTLAAFIRDMIPRARARSVRGEEAVRPTRVLRGRPGWRRRGSRTYGRHFYEDIEIISITHNRAQVEIPATVNLTANVTYACPGTGIWGPRRQGVDVPGRSARRALIERRTTSRLASRSRLRTLTRRRFALCGFGSSRWTSR
jgi:hypothetical protein